MLKKMICGIIIFGFLSAGLIKAQETIRERLYRRFGPPLIEAVVLVVKDEINILRKNAGLPERTDEQVTQAIENKLATLKRYEWMKNQGFPK